MGAGRRAGHGTALWVGGALVAASAALLCLIPRPEGDLFFALRTGEDWLRSGRLPRADAYSWSAAGRRWDVPEWGAFALYALAYRAGGFLGTWALMAALAVGAALIAWGRLAGRVGAAWAFPLVSLMLLAMSGTLQERPYAFTYLLLAVALALLGRGRAGGGPPPARPHAPMTETRDGGGFRGDRGVGDHGANAEAGRLRPPSEADGGAGRGAGGEVAWRPLLALPPLCAVWANLHQGVVVLPLLILVYALGDAVTGARARAGRMGLLAGACGLAALASPYGWGLYRNVFVTLGDPALMAHVTEWEPAWSLPVGQSAPGLLLAGVCALGLAASRRRPRLPDALAALALGAEALLHVRNVALFAVGSVVILAPHWGDAVRRLQGGRSQEGRSPTPARASAARGALLCVLALLYVGTVGLVALAGLRRAGLGQAGLGQAGLGQAGLGAAAAELGRYPAGACAFMDAAGFPPGLRLLNDLGDGGYLVWREPRAPVFIDGRLDVYAGRTFDDNLVLVRADGSPAWAALVRRYDFDGVLTGSRREAAAFAALPGWRLVYADPPGSRPRHRLLLRLRPRSAPWSPGAWPPGQVLSRNNDHDDAA